MKSMMPSRSIHAQQFPSSRLYAPPPRTSATAEPKSGTSSTSVGAVFEQHEVMPRVPNCKGVYTCVLNRHSSAPLPLAAVGAVGYGSNLPGTSASNTRTSAQIEPGVFHRGMAETEHMHCSNPLESISGQWQEQQRSAVNDFTIAKKPGCVVSWCGPMPASRERAHAAMATSPEIALRNGRDDVQLPAHVASANVLTGKPYKSQEEVQTHCLEEEDMGKEVEGGQESRQGQEDPEASVCEKTCEDGEECGQLVMLRHSVAELEQKLCKIRQQVGEDAAKSFFEPMYVVHQGLSALERRRSAEQC